MLYKTLPRLKEEYGADVAVVNGENAAGGTGLTRKVLDEIKAAGADVVTSGNHIWDKKEVLDFIDEEPYLLRPANYPPGTPGKGSCVIDVRGVSVGVLNLSGRTFMPALDCPFQKAAELVDDLSKACRYVLVDFHAEATSEKLAMGWFLDGRVAAVVGTHTHVPTADERILPAGTAYITDLGMTGPWNSVIGADKDAVIGSFLRRLPARFEPAKGEKVLSGVYLELDDTSRKATRFERILVRDE